MLEEVVVSIWLTGQWVPAGLLRYAESGRTARSAFRYGRGYLRRADALSLDPIQLPLGPAQYDTEEGFAVFNGIRDAGPERWGRYLLERRFGGGISELEYIASTSADRVGGLAFGPAPDEEPQVWTPDGFRALEPRRLDVAACAGAVEDAIRDEETERLRKLLAYGPSLGGARPKATVTWDDAPHLAKFSVSLDARDEPRIEYATMTLARSCGLDVPHLSFVEVDGRTVYLVRRFDRGEGEAPIPFVSGLTATGLHESDYPRWSYLRLCDAVVRLSPAPESDLRELFRRMVFNILVFNNDDHPRNFGFLHAGGGRWRLSPLFDVVPSDQRSESYFLAMEVGLEGRAATLRNALSSAERFRLDRAEARRIVDELRTTVAETWEAHFTGCGVEGPALNAVRRNLARPLD